MRKESDSMNMKPIENCAYCGGKVMTRYGYGGILFFDCRDCGACVSFKNTQYPLRIQADDPVACFNRRCSRSRKGEAKS